MDETRDATGPAEQGASNAAWWTSDLSDKFGSVSLVSQDQSLNKSAKILGQDEPPYQTASQVLWTTGMLSEPIPNGFYSVIPVDITKVKMDIIRPWIANRVTELLGFEDEVLITYIYGLLDGKVQILLNTISQYFHTINVGKAWKLGKSIRFTSMGCEDDIIQTFYQIQGQNARDFQTAIS